MKRPSNMTKEELITEINVLGPWTHGQFDIGNGLIIEETDVIQKKRLLIYKDYFEDIISKYYQKTNLINKKICEVGCNTGYFLFELIKKFKFKVATGLEPREKNIQKARFIADLNNLPESEIYFKKFDILSCENYIPTYDIVLMPGVLHHIGNHFLALSNLCKMTKELCIIETIVLPETIHSNKISNYLELDKENLYLKEKKYYGLTGYKFENNNLDGSSFKAGIVGIPTVNSLIMLLNEVGFSNIKIYKTPEELRKKIYTKNTYRDIHVVIVTASKKHEGNSTFIPDVKKIQKQNEYNEFSNYIPIEIIQPLYEFTKKNDGQQNLPNICKLIIDSEYYYQEDRGIYAAKKLATLIQNSDILRIIFTFKHAFNQKISFEYAKSCYHIKAYDISKSVANELIRTVNLDWRTVYKTYYLLALIYSKEHNNMLAEKMNTLSLRAYNDYTLAIDLSSIIKNNLRSSK